MVEKWFRQIMAEQQQFMFESKWNTVATMEVARRADMLPAQEEEMKRVKEVQKILGDVSKSTSMIMKGIAKIDKTLSGTLQCRFR